MWRNRYISAIGCLASVFACQDVNAQFLTDGGQTITAAELRASGVTRLGNVLMLVNGARYSSIDGFTVVPSFAGLAPLQDRSWTVEVDGLPVEAGVLDVENLNALSIPVTSVDSIVVRTQPSIVRGRLQQGGVVRVYTRGAAPSGYHVRATMSATNETGDPGPFRYADPDLANRNVDKEGPDASLDVGLSNAGLSVSAGGVYQQTIPSDPAVFARNYRAFDKPSTPEMRVVAPFVKGGYAVGRLSGALRVSGAVFDDMMYSREIAREVPAQYRRVSVAGRTGWQDDRGTSWTTEYDFSSRTVSNNPGATRIPLDWLEESGSVSVYRTGAIRKARLASGISTSYLSAKSRVGLPRRQSIWSPRVFASIQQDGEKSRAAVDVFAEYDDTGVGGGGSALFGRRLAPDHEMILSGTLVQVLPSETNPVAFWAYRGLSLLPESDFTSRGGEKEMRFASFDLLWRWSPAANATVTSSSFARRFSGLRYSEREISADGVGFRVASREYSAAWGATVGINSVAQYAVGTNSYSMSFSYQTVLAGNQLFYDAFSTVPRRQVRLEAINGIGDRFSIKNTLFHYSGSYWSEFEGVAEEGGYSSRVPGFVRWDIAVFKRLAQDRVQLSAVVENVLNAHVGFHPIGATFDRALRVQLAVAFD
ncbi:MAG: hypothetical protein R2832_05270 [Rhodothermales bacterium]